MDLVLMQAVQMLWQGMLGVFVVIGLIALVVAALTRLTQKYGNALPVGRAFSFAVFIICKI